MEIGLVFALLTAVSFALSTIFLRRGVSRAGESFSAVVISVFIGTFFFLLVVAFTGEWSTIWTLSGRGLVLLGAGGILHFVAGRFFSYTSVRLIGANKASAITRTNIFYAVVLGMVFLGETLTLSLGLGILCIAGGAILVSLDKEGVSVKTTPGEPDKVRAKGVLNALGAGFAWGTSGVLVKPAITEMGSPSAGALVSFVAAFLVVAGLLIRRQHRDQLAKLRRSALIPLTIAALFTTVAHLSRYFALSYSPVSVVTPLVSIDVLLVLLLSFLLNRKLEVFTWRVVVGMVATAVGAVLLLT